MSDRFEGFGPGAFAFFDELAEHNDRAWFAEHRARFEREVRDPLELLLEELCDELQGRVKLFRQHRDVRFSKDKSPYKLTTYGIVFDRPGTEAALYLQLSPAGLYAATGYYELAPDQLARMREAIDDEGAGAALEAAVGGAERAGLEVGGDAVKTAPRGWSRDHPRIGLLRLKHLIAGARLPAGSIGREEGLAFARGTWAAAAPTVAWLDAHVGPSTRPAEERRGRG